jgi:uncharacterized membrane protein
MEELTPEQARTYSMLAWLFAPFTSFVWKDSKDPLLAGHARQSLYLGIANIITTLIIFVLQMIYYVVFSSLLWSVLWGMGTLISCAWQFIWLLNALFVIAPRVMGIYKASLNEQWQVPYVTKLLERYIKL